MKQHKYLPWLKVKPPVGLALAGLLMLSLISSAWASGNKTGWTRFAITGDHRCLATAAAVNANKTGYLEGGVNTKVLKDLAIALKNEQVEFVLDVGDLVAKFDGKLLTGNLPDGTKITADRLIADELGLFTTTWNTWAGELPIYPIRGNHEQSASAATYLAGIAALPGIGDMLPNTTSPSEADQGLTYAFAVKNCVFVALDVYMNPSIIPTIRADTLDWMSELLADSAQRHVFVWAHTPAYEVWDSENLAKSPPVWSSRDGLASPKGSTGPVNCLAAADVRDPFWNILGDVKGSYFCGHDHTYLRGWAPAANGYPVMQTIIGNGGAPPYPPYPADPYVESDITVGNCGSPRPSMAFFDQSGSLGQDSYGYVLIEIHGAHATATYKAEDRIGGTFSVRDQWSWKIIGND